MSDITPLVLRAQSNDDEARAEIFELYAKRLYRLSEIWSQGTSWDRHDLAGYGAYGLHEAIDTFDPDREDGKNFTGWADMLMQQAIKRGKRTHRAQKRSLPKHRLVMLDTASREENQDCHECSENDVEDRVSGPEQEIAFQDDCKGLYKALIKHLPEKDLELVWCYFGMGSFEPMSARQIARIFGMKTRTVTYRVRRSLRILREAVCD